MLSSAWSAEMTLASSGATLIWEILVKGTDADAKGTVLVTIRCNAQLCV